MCITDGHVRLSVQWSYPFLVGCWRTPKAWSEVGFPVSRLCGTFLQHSPLQRGQTLRMCLGVCSSVPHSHCAVSASPILAFRHFSRSQCAVRRQKIVVCFFRSCLVMWSCYGQWPWFLLCHSVLNFRFKSVLASLQEMELLSCRRWLASVRATLCAEHAKVTYNVEVLLSSYDKYEF